MIILNEQPSFFESQKLINGMHFEKCEKNMHVHKKLLTYLMRQKQHYLVL